MRKHVRILLVAVSMSLLPGCGDQLYLENTALILAAGMDLDDEDRMIVYSSNPVFSPEAKEKVNLSATKTITLRKARNELDSMSYATAVSGKLQTILIGKKFLQHKDVFPYFDVLFRDPKNDINARVVAVDGPVRDVMYIKMDDKGRIGTILRDLVDTTYKNGTTVITPLQQFHRQFLDKRITPYITELKAANNELIITGATLLDKKGKYVTSLTNQECATLLLLQQDIRNPLSYTFQLPPKQVKATEEESKITIDIPGAKYEVKTNFKNGRFVFDINLKLKVVIMERLFRLDQEKEGKKLEKLLAEAMKKECEAFVKKIQKHSLDPIGFGVYAHAYQYNQWKKVESDWGKAFADAQVNLTTSVEIVSFGVAM